MADKRKFNGGNSTKSNKATDKRINQNKKLLERYISEDFKYEDLKQLMSKLLKEGKAGDTKSTQLFLSYVIGKPKEFKEVDLKGSGLNIIIGD